RTNRDRTRKLVALAVGALLYAALPVTGQERFGEIGGAITDPSGAVVPNAKVTLTNRDTNRVITLKTGTSGSYIATNLEPGRYNIRVEASGFSAYEIPDVSLLVGKTLKVDAQLKVGATSETVQVSESAPLIDVTGNTVAHNITAEDFDRAATAPQF